MAIYLAANTSETFAASRSMWSSVDSIFDIASKFLIEGNKITCLTWFLRS